MNPSQPSTAKKPFKRAHKSLCSSAKFIISKPESISSRISVTTSVEIHDPEAILAIVSFPLFHTRVSSHSSIANMRSAASACAVIDSASDADIASQRVA